MTCQGKHVESALLEKFFCVKSYKTLDTAGRKFCLDCLDFIGKLIMAIETTQTNVIFMEFMTYKEERKSNVFKTIE